MAVDIEKAFDSINHSHLMCVLKIFGFSSDFRTDTNLNEKPGILCYQCW